MSNTRRPLPASYVVRLYRADPSRIDALAGLIEHVDAGLTTSFRTGSELLRQLHGDTGALPGAEPGAGATDANDERTAADHSGETR